MTKNGRRAEWRRMTLRLADRPGADQRAGAPQFAPKDDVVDHGLEEGEVARHR